VKKLLFGALMMVLSSMAHADSGTCFGKFPNLITDVCWSCLFPLKMFGSFPIYSDGQEDFDSNPGSGICACGNPIPKIGVLVSFFEPVRQVEITRTPYCLVSLGGIKVDVGINGNSFGTVDNSYAGGFSSGNGSGGIYSGSTSFRHVHWYVNPILAVLQVLLDNACLENKGFDLAYLSELDPTHNDDELEGLLSPDAFLFGGAVAQGACSADCISSTAGFGSNTLFWCAGCNGSLYPLSGNVQNHIGGVQASSLIVQRLAAKLHRAGTQWAAYGDAGRCGYYPQIVMDKRQYKYSMIYPVPQTKKISGRCCQPFGRTTILWGAGREYPVQGEDFGYIVFRKRDCCQGAVGF
jgi:conjugal transfer pilus assembly protein TraU